MEKHDIPEQLREFRISIADLRTILEKMLEEDIHLAKASAALISHKGKRVFAMNPVLQKIAPHVAARQNELESFESQMNLAARTTQTDVRNFLCTALSALLAGNNQQEEISLDQIRNVLSAVTINTEEHQSDAGKEDWKKGIEQMIDDFAYEIVEKFLAINPKITEQLKHEFGEDEPGLVEVDKVVSDQYVVPTRKMLKAVLEKPGKHTEH